MTRSAAFLIEEEGTASTFRACLEVFAAHGLPSSLYTDCGSHYFHTPQADGAVDKDRLNQALKHLGVEHIPAYSPEARGRSERMFGTLQDRLIKELAKAGIGDIAGANAWIRDVCLPAHNARFAKPAALAEETAFVYAAALRVARFGSANEHSDWETAHHVFTYANAVHRMLKRIEGANQDRDFEAVRGILHGAMALYLARYLNVPPARIPGDGGDDCPTICLTMPRRSASLCSMPSTGSGRSIWRHVWWHAISRLATHRRC